MVKPNCYYVLGKMFYLKDIVLTTKQLDGEEVIPLKFVKFQNVQVLLQ